jgi:AbrB family looped-hinge helix DNA binding protein
MKIGERGQVTIPKKMREKYGLLPQIEIEFVEEKSGILLTKMVRHKSPVDKVYGILKKDASTDDYIESIRGR